MKSEPGNSDSQDQLNRLAAVKEYVSDANDYFENGDWNSAEAMLDKALEHCLWYVNFFHKKDFTSSYQL